MHVPMHVVRTRFMETTHTTSLSHHLSFFFYYLRRSATTPAAAAAIAAATLLLVVVFILSAITATTTTFPTPFFSSTTAATTATTISAVNDLPAGFSPLPQVPTPASSDEQDPVREKGCDLFDGSWVVDDGGVQPRYPPGSCPFVNAAFNCAWNGRQDSGYLKLRWQPNHCHLPRLEGKEIVEVLRGKRVVMVGDSLNRNMWQSLLCLLRESVADKNRLSRVRRSKDYFAVKLYDYNTSIEFAKSPFLVQEEGESRVRLDVMHSVASKYKGADIVVFNTGHWWTHDKPSKGKDYYKEGDVVYPEMKAMEAYKKALSTWAKWVDANIESNRTRVFFRGLSSTHFRGRQWNSNGDCGGEVEPIVEESHLAANIPMVKIVESVLSEMKTPVSYLNVTRLTAYRKDGHPASFRPRTAKSKKNKKEKIKNDCSHWCLPGVPDAWNELLLAMLLIPS